MAYKVVIIEDESILLKALNIQLLNAGLEVLSAMDGETGLRLVEKEKPDIVLLDLILPKMHGFEVLAFLKKLNETKNIPVIILSNLEQKEECVKGLALGAADYFIKSNTNLHEVELKIKKILKIK